MSFLKVLFGRSPRRKSLGTRLYRGPHPFPSR